MTLNDQYNKTISFKELTPSRDPSKFDLCFYTYYGKLTTIVEQFNHQEIKKSKKIVESSVTESDLRRNALQISAFLNYPNIFLYLLTFDADPYYCDDNNQSTWHIIGYRGHTQLMGILLNHMKYTMKFNSLKIIDNIKGKFGFSNLDIVKGKLSSAVHKSSAVLTKFDALQKALKTEAMRVIEEFVDSLENGLLLRDKERQTPLHLAAMSKFPLSHKVIYQILDFDFFKNDQSWDDYFGLFYELQFLEIKAERMNLDPRRCMRFERELSALLGEDAVKNELGGYYQELKKKMLKKIINTQDNNGDSLLHISAFHGDFRIVNRLVFYGGDKKLQNNEGKLPVDLSKDNFVRKVLTNLNKAAKDSDEKNIQELVNFGENINAKISIFNQAPIHKIIESKDDKKHEVLKKLLELGSDPNIKDSNGWSALHYACQLGDLESVQILIAAKAVIDTYSNNQRIPLHLASYQNFPEIVQYLLENDSNPNYKDELGCTPLHLAAKNGNTKCLDILLSYNGELYETDFRGWNILHYAAFHGHKKTVRYISKYDADYDILRNMKNSQNKIPIEIVREPDIKPYFMSLWHAAKEGNLDMTRNLINSGEKIDEQSHFEFNTPMHFAVINNHFLEVRLLLLDYNARIDIKNKFGKIPLYYAKELKGPLEQRYEEVIDLDREKIDLRKYMDKILKKNGEKLDATICRSNYNIRVWTAHDSNKKILNILGDEEEEENVKDKEIKKGDEEIKN